MLSPECRPVAAVLFMSGAVRLHCDFYQLCAVLAEVQKICPLGKLEFERQNRGLFSGIVYRALAQMHRAGFVEWKDAENLIVVKRNLRVFTAFVAELNQMSGFEGAGVKRRFREAGDWIAGSIEHDDRPLSL
jgi:hypothetical protein